MTLELSRRTVMQGASKSVIAAAMPNLVSVPPPPLPDIETTLGPDAMAAARAYFAEYLTVPIGLQFDDDGRFAMSSEFRSGLTRFLLGEDHVLVRRPHSPNIGEAYVRWHDSVDRGVFVATQTMLRREVHAAFRHPEWKKCCAYFGALRDEPHRAGLLLTVFRERQQLEYPDAVFRAYWVL